MRLDSSSYFDDSQPRARSLHLRLRAEAGSSPLEGEATLVFPGRGVEGTLDLDTQCLEVHSAYVTATAAPLPFELGEEEPGLGRRLRLQLPPDTMGITLAFETGPGALDPRRARELMPCQDCGEVPVAFDAELLLPEGQGWRSCRFSLPRTSPTDPGLLRGMAEALLGKSGK